MLRICLLFPAHYDLRSEEKRGFFYRCMSGLLAVAYHGVSEQEEVTAKLKK